MDHHFGIGRYHSKALGAGGGDHRCHTGSHAGHDRSNDYAALLRPSHRIDDGVASGDAPAAAAVYPEVYILRALLGEGIYGYDRLVGDLIIYRFKQRDPALLLVCRIEVVNASALPVHCHGIG